MNYINNNNDNYDNNNDCSNILLGITKNYLLEIFIMKSDLVKKNSQN